MKTSLLAALVFVAGTASASAADMVDPVYDWSGLYIGAHGSYIFSDNDMAVANFSAETDPESFGIGGQIGFREQLSNNFVLGLEADATWLLGNRSRAAYLIAGGADGLNELNWDASLRASVGYAQGAFLPYLTGGVAIIDEEGCAALTGAPNCFPGTSFDATRMGWTAGAGMAYAVNENWVVNAEYRYADFGKKSYFTPATAGNTTTSDLQTHKLLLGVSYKF